MKKFYLLVFSVVSFLSISSVSATTFTSTEYGSYFDSSVAFYLTHEEKINELIDVWEENLSSQYPYYYIRYVDLGNSGYEISLEYSDNSDIYSNYSAPSITTEFITSANTVFSPDGCIDLGSCNEHLTNFILYKSSNNTFTIYNANNYPGSYSAGFGLIFGTETNSISPQSLPLINHGFKFTDKSVRGVIANSNEYTGYYDKITFSTYVSSTYSLTITSFDVSVGNVFPDVVSLYNGTYSPIEPNTYTEIDLNSYDYIILSLKSYTPIDTQYSTTIYTQGSLCSTPVYNYGMREKKDYYTGYQVQGCTEYYTQFTPVNFYILPQDIENHAVYYIKSNNTYVTNKIKVDNNIFDVNYFTSENSSNPSVSINGRNYPTIPYNDLTDTAIISSEEGYISGQVCSLGDVNCYYENTGIDINNLFSHPLVLLQSVWGAITNVFSVIAVFISLLPPTLQGFMFTAFMLAIVLGILKIIIG